MAGQINQMQSMFDPKSRHANFGNVLEKFVVKGIRGHKLTPIDILSPITAFCGKNGSGKSTLLELAAVCFKNTIGTDYKVSSFLMRSKLDTHPYDDDANVQFTVRTAPDKVISPTITRNSAASRWDGYEQRVERPVLLLAAGRHMARSERRDLVFENAERFSITSKTPLATEVAAHSSMILASSYESLSEAQLEQDGNPFGALVAKRHDLAYEYSELHMGCGEARIQALVEALERAPERSLVLLEEPEAAVHFAAQARLGQYLVDVVNRKRHQILLTTHSEHILRELPDRARVFLRIESDNIDVVRGITAVQASSLLSERATAALVILVEDECAKQVLQHLLHKHDKTLRETVRVEVAGYRTDKGWAGGGDSAITLTMNCLLKSGLRVAAVLDGDMKGDPKKYIFKLPGSKPPELELLEQPAVRKHWTDTYGTDCEKHIATLKGVDHHELFRRLSDFLNANEAFLVGEAARVYAANLNSSEVGVLVEQLSDASRRK